MKTICLSQTRCLTAASLMVVGVLLTCYSAMMNLRHGGIQHIENVADVVPAEEDGDAEYLEKRHEFLDRFFGTGPGGVSPSAYMAALAAARSLPPSPLLQGGKFVSPEAPGASPWTSPIAPPMQNSYGGNASARVHALAIDPINANVVYTGSFGGLAKTTDGGATWRYLSDAWASQSVSAIAVNPAASNDVYVGTGREDYGPYGVGLYHSFDGGSTWSSPVGNDQFEGTYVRTIVIDANTSGVGLTATVYVANGGSDTSGLWCSTDSGTTWTRLRQGPPPSIDDGIYDVAIDSSTHPSTLYITEQDGTFKSIDSGQSWTLIHEVLGNSRNRLSVVNSMLYLLGPRDPDHNLYKSMDRGTTWIQIPTHCPCAPDVCGNRNPPGPPICADSCANRCGNIGFSVFAVDPVNPQIIVGGNMALYRTDNEGMTWTEIGHWWGDPDKRRSVHTDQRVIAFSETTPDVLYDGNDGGIVRSTNGGLDWANLNQNLPGALMYSVALSRDGSMIAGTQDNGVVFSKAGASWDMIFGGDSNHDLIEPTGRTWAYSVGYTPNSFRRFNRETNEKINISPAQFIVSTDPLTYEPCAFFPTFSMNPSSPTHVIAACQHVVRTFDAPTVTREGWMAIGGSLADTSQVINAACEAPSNSNVIFAVVDRKKVWVTTNANSGPAAIWREITPDLEGGVLAVTVHPTDPQTAYLARNKGVYKTTDMGTTWAQHGVQNLIYREVAIDPANPQHIFAASNAGVFASTDGGTSWGNMSDGIPAGMVLSALSFNASSRQLAASTYGRGVYMLHLDPPPRSRPTPQPRP